MKRLRRKFARFPSPLPIVFILVVTTAVILYGRGYRPDLSQNTLKPTGLLSATSDPDAAQVYIDGELKTATKNTINIDPGWYTVKIAKEGYIPWEKRLRVQGEVVTSTDAFLFPTSPSLSPLTSTGIEKPLLSSDGTRLAYTIPTTLNNGITTKKAGLWVYELTDRPLGFNRDPHQVGLSTDTFNFSDAKVIWSPDSTQLMAQVGSVVRLYNVSKTDDFQIISITSYSTILLDWQETKQTADLQKLSTFKKPIIDIVSTSSKVITFSPDEKKILYEATGSATIPQIINPPLIGSNPTEEQRTIEAGKLYVYDSFEDKNYFVLDKNELPKPVTSAIASIIPKRVVLKTPFPSPLTFNTELQPNIGWFPTSRHLVLTLPGKIDIMEYDRTNWVTVYSGPFVEGFFAIWPNASRIIVMTNLNPGQSNLPNLYTVNLR